MIASRLGETFNLMCKLLARYRLFKWSHLLDEFPKVGSLVVVKSKIGTSFSYSLSCPETHLWRDEKIKQGEVCVFLGFICDGVYDNHPRPLILYSGNVSYIVGYQRAVNIIEEIK